MLLRSAFITLLVIPMLGCFGSKSTTKGTVDEKTCGRQFYQATQPNLPTNLAKDGEVLCFNGFAVFYSPKTKTPLWSAEYLTKERVLKARQLSRVDNFHEERSIKNGARLSDYTATGYDRGHLAPNGDMGDRKSQFDSFSLANIAPQAPKNNRGIWSSLEGKVRDAVVAKQEAYVVTGVLFIAPKFKSLHGNVVVPSHFYKAVYMPNTKQSMVYVAKNTDDGQIIRYQLNDFTKKTGINPFPSPTK